MADKVLSPAPELLPRRATGSHLYKYSNLANPERLKDIILKHELYLPSLDQLNDPADGRPKLAQMSESDMFDFLCKDFIKRHPHWTSAALRREAEVLRFNVQYHGRTALQRLHTKIIHAELESFRIYSLSKRYDNLSLWAKYAADHSGYCLEFCNEGPMFEHAKEVIYGPAPPMDITKGEHRSGYWFFFKSQEWSNEEEVRLVQPRGYKSTVSFNPKWLTRLILGKDMSDANRTLLREWAKQREPELLVVNAYYDEVDQVIKLKA
jgi:hypothetical protein